MSLLTRCRRRGREFVADRQAIVADSRHLCPRCRGPLPPMGGVPASDHDFLLPCPPEAAP